MPGRFIGLQGSYGRGEASETSDIDVVLILDRLDSADLKKYSHMLDGLPQRKLVCRFVSGQKELKNWEPSILKELYKSERFTVQAILFLQTGKYGKRRDHMLPLLRTGERRIMENGAKLCRMLETGNCPEAEFERLSAELLQWASEWIQGEQSQII